VLTEDKDVENSNGAIYLSRLIPAETTRFGINKNRLTSQRELALKTPELGKNPAFKQSFRQRLPTKINGKQYFTNPPILTLSFTQVS